MLTEQLNRRIDELIEMERRLAGVRQAYHAALKRPGNHRFGEMRRRIVEELEYQADGLAGEIACALTVRRA